MISLELLHPAFRAKFEALQQNLSQKHIKIDVLTAYKPIDIDKYKRGELNVKEFTWANFGLEIFVEIDEKLSLNLTKDMVVVCGEAIKYGFAYHTGLFMGKNRILGNGIFLVPDSVYFNMVHPFLTSQEMDDYFLKNIPIDIHKDRTAKKSGDSERPEVTSPTKKGLLDKIFKGKSKSKD